MSAPALTKMLTIKNRLGLHARAAAQLVQTASKFPAEISVTKDGQTVSARSILGLMMLAAGIGSSIEVSIDGEQASEAMAAIEELIEAKFNEE